ncbi:hypothetical protein M569_15689, partial [Genlisea aurea]
FDLIRCRSSFNYNAVVRVHTLLGCPSVALGYFVRMRRESVSPDFHTFPFLLKACGLLPDSLFLARALHSGLIKFGFPVDLFVCNTLACTYCRFGDTAAAKGVLEGNPYRDVVGFNVLIDGLVKAGEIDHARKVFDEMPERDSVSWSTLVAGYAKENRCAEAIRTFDRMAESRVKFNNVALVSVLSACARIGQLSKGKQIHHHIVANGIELDSYLATALVDLYAKCGCIDTAEKVFSLCRDKNNTALWNSILVGLGIHGSGSRLLHYFSRMTDSGIKPDRISLLGTLAGCSHSGLIGEAMAIFASMETLYGVPRDAKHYACVVDLLARAGYVEEAAEVVIRGGAPDGGDVVFSWEGLLGGCKIHGNVGVAEAAALRVMESKPEDGGVYSELAHVYAGSQRWDDVAKVRMLRDGRKGVEKVAGWSSIQLNGEKEMHEFVSGDSLHPLSGEIYFLLNGL